MQKNKKIKQYSKVFGLDLELLKKRYYEKYHLKLDDSKYKKGSDFVSGKFYIDDENIDADLRFGYILINLYNGHIIIYDNTSTVIATHESSELDDIKWYSELLELIYQ